MRLINLIGLVVTTILLYGCDVIGNRWHLSYVEPGDNPVLFEVHGSRDACEKARRHQEQLEGNEGAFTQWICEKARP